MKTLIEQFKSILSSQCLSQSEKEYLKNQFNEFMERRALIARKSIEIEEHDETGQDWIRNNFG